RLYIVLNLNLKDKTKRHEQERNREGIKITALATISVLPLTSTMASKSTHAHLSLVMLPATYGVPCFWYRCASNQLLPPSGEISTLSMPLPPPDKAYPATMT